MSWSDWVISGAAIVAILDYFGIKPKNPGWGFPIATNRKWKLAVMLFLVGASLSISGYRAMHPKIVEKPVEKIVEKTVPGDCPIIAAVKGTPKLKKPPSHDVSNSGLQNSSVGNLSQGQGSAYSQNQSGGITAGTLNLGPPPAKIEIRPLAQNQQIAEVDGSVGFTTTFQLNIVADSSISSLMVRAESPTVTHLMLSASTDSGFRSGGDRGGKGYYQRNFDNVAPGKYTVIVDTRESESVTLISKPN